MSTIEDRVAVERLFPAVQDILKQSGFGKDLDPERLDHFLRIKVAWIRI